MKSRSRLALGTLTAVALTTALSGSPAFATDELDCGASDDYVAVTYVQNGAEHIRCWDNPDVVPLNLDNVTSFYSGANKVVVFWTTGRGWEVDVLEPHTSVPFTGADTYRVFGFEVV
ncbi:hypothetical protein [Streptomyces sp. NPDC017890]|uniref:hypothetical protein n=1 Tax=Streptomyces sp. NPDC017890 TaxID=3365015 RepID=UPI0037A2A8F8